MDRAKCEPALSSGRSLCIWPRRNLDFVSGRKKRAPKWTQIVGVEWLYRALTDQEDLHELQRCLKCLILLCATSAVK